MTPMIVRARAGIQVALGLAALLAGTLPASAVPSGEIYRQGGFPPVVRQTERFWNPSGRLGTFLATGPIDTATHPFFQALGTNGRSCATCHQPPSALGLSVRNIRSRFAATQATDPLFAPIVFDWDLDKRRARIEVTDTVRAHSEPIRNPVTDAEHRMITVLPQGWVFHEAENVAGFAKGTGPIRFDLNRRHSSMAHVAWGPQGLVHSYDGYKQKYGRP